jgi:hypothetical protein
MKKIIVTACLLITSFAAMNAYAQETKNKQDQGLSFSIQLNEFPTSLQVAKNVVNPLNVLDISFLEYPNTIGYQIVDPSGAIVQFGEIDQQEIQSIPFDQLNDGTYFVNLMDGRTAKSAFLSIQKYSLSAQLNE